MYERKEKARSLPSLSLPFRISFAQVIRGYSTSSRRERKATFESLSMTRSFSRCFFFFLFPTLLLTLFFSFVTRCPFAKRSVFACSARIYMSRWKCLLSSARIMRYPLARRFASERRKAPISRNVDEEKEKRSDVFGRYGDTEKSRANRPGGRACLRAVVVGS